MDASFTLERTTEALNRDVSFLGRVLGNVLREQGGDELFEAVEGLRQACRHMRHHNCEVARKEIHGRVESLQLPLALDVVRAFTLYFHLINMAEESHRLRRLAEREIADWPAPRRDSLAACLHALKRAGASEAEVRDLLHDLHVRPVFTAHPTEARRMTLLRHLRRIARLAAQLGDEAVPPQQRKRLTDELYAEVTNLWQTNELRLRQQTVLDEVTNGLYYIEESVFDAGARLYRDLHDALGETYPDLQAELPIFLDFGSWIGGDRDGNPNVTAEITEQTVRMHKSVAIARYRERVADLVDAIAVSTSLVDVSPELLASLESDRKAFGPAADHSTHGRADEPYREKVDVILKRLDNTRVSAAGAEGGRAYANAGELLADLELMAQSLESHCGTRIARDALQTLIWQVRVFGFHLATLDVRQHRDRHLAALDEILPLPHNSPRFCDLDEEGRTNALNEALAHSAEPNAPETCSPETRETLDTFRAIGRMQGEAGADAINTYIVSFTTAPSDLLAVLYFARIAGLYHPESGKSALRVVPLFETEQDLAAAPAIMASLWTNEFYGKNLAAWGGEQEIMLGYSDSDKDAGYVTSNWLLYRAQQELSALGDKHGVRVTFFHGRGGAIGRGGGPLQRAILGQPAGTIKGGLKVTEQGEVLFTRYANPGIAHRHLEQVVSAVMRAQSRLAHPPDGVEAWEGLAEDVSGAASNAYRTLVSDDPGFLHFFEEGTPLRSIVRLNIASRPAKRRDGALRFADLRAIPWVFAWTQARYGLPGWYGLGSGLQAGIDAGRLDDLRAMYREWPFFRWLVDAAQISLGKADLNIAAEYSTLVPEEDVRARYTGPVHDEYRRTVGAVNQVVNQERLLDSWGMLQRSIDLRNPYVDPMSYIQVRAIRDVRTTTDEEQQALLRSIIDRSVTGIAAGLQNTG